MAYERQKMVLNNMVELSNMLTDDDLVLGLLNVKNDEDLAQLAQKYNIEMPIVNAVYDILYNGLEPREAVTKLMTREKKAE